MLTSLALTVAGINSGASQTLPKVSTAGMSSVYQTPDGSLKETISHTVPKDGTGDIRSLIKVAEVKSVTNNGITSNLRPVILSFNIVRPATGYTVTEVQALITGFKSQLTDTLVAQLLGLES